MHQFKVNDKYDFESSRKGDELLINGETIEADAKQLSHSHWHIIHKLQSYNAEVVSFDAAEKTHGDVPGGNLRPETGATP